MSDEEYGSRRRGRRGRDGEEEEEEDEHSSMRSRRRGRGRDDEDEEEPTRSRRGRQREESEEAEEEEEVAPARGRRGRQSSEDTSVSDRAAAPEPGTTIGKLMENRRKKLQQNLVDAMFKLAEKKYGRKRPQRGDKGNAMEDYELYLRSIKAKVKTAQDKLNAVLKQKKDIDAKVATAEKDVQLQQSKFDKAEEEKQNAINEGRDPELPKDFIVPQRAKKANAGLGALVMKASAGMWEEKFSAMRTKKTTSDTPEWMAKQKKSDKTSALLKVGKTTTEKKGSRRRRKDDEEKPNPFQINLKKTGLRKEEDETTGKKSAKTSEPAADEGEASRRGRRGRARDSDDE